MERRRFLSLVASTAAAALVAACTNSGARTPDPPAGTTTTPATGGKPAPTTGSGSARGAVTIWAMGAEGEKLQQLTDPYVQANPGSQVTVTPIAWDVAHDKLITAVAGNQTPDVSQMGTTWMAEFGSAGALEPAPSSFNASAFFPSAWETVTVNNTAHGVPWYVETRVLYARTDLAGQANLSPAPGTWEELKALAKALKEQGSGRHGIALSAKNWQELLPFVWQNGGRIISSEGTVTATDPKVIEALAYYQSFFKEGLAAPPQQGFDVTQGFIRGTHPLFFSGPWHMALIRDQAGESLQGKWDIALMPKRVTRTSFLGGSDLAVFKAGAGRAAAWPVVQYLSQPDTQARWYGLVAALPAVKASWEQGALATDKHLKIFRQQLDDAKAPPAIPQWQEIADTIDTAMERATIGNESAQQAAATLQEKAGQVLR